MAAFRVTPDLAGGVSLLSHEVILSLGKYKPGAVGALFRGNLQCALKYRVSNDPSLFGQASRLLQRPMAAMKGNGTK